MTSSSFFFTDRRRGFHWSHGLESPFQHFDSLLGVHFEQRIQKIFIRAEVGHDLVFLVLMGRRRLSFGTRVATSSSRSDRPGSGSATGRTTTGPAASRPSRRTRPFGSFRTFFFFGCFVITGTTRTTSQVIAHGVFGWFCEWRDTDIGVHTVFGSTKGRRQTVGGHRCVGHYH